jgi:hypothetical protein
VTGLTGVDAEALRQLPLRAFWPLERCQQIGNSAGEEDLAILTDLSNSSGMSQCELDKSNFIDFMDEDLSPEDRQDMEDFMKKWAEQDRQEV